MPSLEVSGESDILGKSINNSLFYAFSKWFSSTSTSINAVVKSSILRKSVPLLALQENILKNRKQRHLMSWDATLVTYNSSRSATIHSMMLVNAFSRWTVKCESVNLNSIYSKNVFTTQRRLQDSKLWLHLFNDKLRTILQLCIAKTTSFEKLGWPSSLSSFDI